MNATSWGKPIGCSVPKSSNIGATCSRAGRYLYMSRTTAHGIAVDGLDGDDGRCIWAECAQHRRSRDSFAAMIRPRPWDYDWMWDATVRGSVAGMGSRIPEGSAS